MSYIENLLYEYLNRDKYLRDYSSIFLFYARRIFKYRESYILPFIFERSRETLLNYDIGGINTDYLCGSFAMRICEFEADIYNDEFIKLYNEFFGITTANWFNLAYIKVRVPTSAYLWADEVRFRHAYTQGYDMRIKYEKFPDVWKNRLRELDYERWYLHD